MQASAIKQFVEWMEPKIDAAALLDLATHSKPARVEEYTTRIKAFPVNINGLVGGSSSRDVPEMPPPDEHARLQADAAAAKRDALTGIGHCIFS